MTIPFFKFSSTKNIAFLKSMYHFKKKLNVFLMKHWQHYNEINFGFISARAFINK